MALEDGPADSGFGDLTLVHNCLPGLHIADIRLETECAGLSLQHPVIINAMTGGAAALLEVNARLAEVALETGAVIAVGSQFAGIGNPEAARSFRVVREVNPKGMIWANIGAYTDPDTALRAVDMIGADALQVHLNAAQEIIMTEGDADFSGWLEQIEKMARRLPVPVIVKETGCGMAGEQIRSLASAGVRAVDVGGAGGTNFIAVEATRAGRTLPADWLAWGIPTAMSAMEAASVLPAGMDLIVSGGVRTPLDALKSFAVGAAAVAVAAPVLRLVEQEGVAAAVEWVRNYLEMMRKGMQLLGRSSVRDTAAHPLVVTGRTAEWMKARGISRRQFACRPQ